MASSRIGKTVLSLAVAGAFAGGVSQARASGFALIEESASGLGTSFAGAAAAAEDASTIFYNPAGMSLLPGMQVSAGVDLINLSAKFSDSASTAAPGRPLGGNGGDAGGLAAVPNVYFAMDVAPDWKVGVGLNVPFGLKTEYTSDWVGRFQAIKSDISTFNLNPSASYKVNDKVSVGFGLDYQTIDAEFTNAINLGGVAEEIADIKAKDNTGWGYNLGVMYQLAPDTRLGFSYRSSIKYHLTGTVTFSANQPVASANVSADITMPDSASIALQHRLNPGWILLADITRTGWSKIKDLTIMSDTLGTLSSTPENFRNTWRFGVGAVHRYDDAWSIKMGLAYDQTPVNDTDRTARLPDNNRLWLSAGGQYRLSTTGTLDFGYAHLFIKDAPISQTNPATAGGGQLVGTYKGSVDILGVQLAHRF
jgi:long-chain fatty acid transport protein